MQKYPKNTRAGRARRMGRTDQFNPSNGEPHTARFLAFERSRGRRRNRRMVVVKGPQEERMA